MSLRTLTRRAGVVLALSVAAALPSIPTAPPAQAVDLSLPSLWQAYKDDFIFGTFGDWSSDQAKYHYRSNSLPNALKLDGQIGNSNTNSLSRQTYLAEAARIDADPTLTEAEKADALEAANEHVVLQPTTGPGQSETVLKQIEAYNAANNLPPDQRKVVRAHVLAWHGGQQPNYFFTDGFYYDAANPKWATPRTMLKRLDDYVHQMMVKYAPYQDVIYSWDVVNEAIDDYSGQIRNGQDPQVGQWGIVFRRPDLDATPDARLKAESAWVRQAFASARKWSNAVGAKWKLYYNDYQDSNKLYEPKLSQTIKMLKPIHDAGNIDGYGMQGRLAWAYPGINQLRAQINAGLTVADEISISESDIRSDLEPNPNYDPTQPTRPVTAADAADPNTQWPTFGSCSWVNKGAANGNTFDVCNSPVRRIPDWGTGSNVTLADSPAIMQKQADFAADWMDLLLSYGGKVKAYQFDGTSDSNTFNRTDGAQLWSGAADHHEKYSFFSVLGAPAREKLRAAIAVDPGDASRYTTDSWSAYARAKQAAAALVPVRIYTIDAVNAVTAATAALTQARQGLVLLNPPTTPGTPGTPTVPPTPGSKGTVEARVRLPRRPTSEHGGKLEVRLVPTTAATGEPTPTGTVVVELTHAGKTVRRTGTLESGVVRVGVQRLAVGTWKVHVSYSGSGGYQALPEDVVKKIHVRR
ncbi:hypothetical protein G5V58_16165 [Nocardioides anomalus]|uniref:Beta-xylanase n=1 Tax=Nocardioides anomalus TaxID=2712223 RepID=A0A6G6WG90_9ACTN|nr:endo-1,4-beta-xylanase [Nocardioides anomalus]QIG44105.1 hypothetical protein G5V58_16165 [Nocardioides anomalus]